MLFLKVDELQLVCKVCKKLLSSKSNLKKHVAQVHGSRVKCNVTGCDSTFTASQSLTRHRRGCHPEANTLNLASTAPIVLASEQIVLPGISLTHGPSGSLSATAPNASPAIELPTSSSLSSSSSPLAAAPLVFASVLPVDAYPFEFVASTSWSSVPPAVVSSSFRPFAVGDILSTHPLTHRIQNSLSQPDSIPSWPPLSARHSVTARDPEWIPIADVLNSFLKSSVGWALTGAAGQRQQCSQKSMNMVGEDLRYILSLALNHQMVHRPLALEVFDEDILVRRVVQKLESISPTLSASRLYNLFLP